MSSREYDEIKNNLTVVMLSKEMSEFYGMTIPRVPMGDMSLAYEITYDDGDKRLVSYADMQDFDITGTELHRDAFESAREHYPAKVCTIEEMLGLPPRMSSPAPTMYVVTNEENDHGAAALLYPGMMEQLAEKIGGDYAIIPSSVHEMMVVTTQGADLHQLETLLQQVNGSDVEPDERLSNTLYCYDAKANMVMRASVYEQLQKRDAMVRENAAAYGTDRGSVLQDLRRKMPPREPAKQDPSRAMRSRRREASL